MSRKRKATSDAEASWQPQAPPAPGQLWPSRPDGQDTFETARNHFDRFLVRERTEGREAPETYVSMCDADVKGQRGRYLFERFLAWCRTGIPVRPGTLTQYLSQIHVDMVYRCRDIMADCGWLSPHEWSRNASRLVSDVTKARVQSGQVIGGISDYLRAMWVASQVESVDASLLTSAPPPTLQSSAGTSVNDVDTLSTSAQSILARLDAIDVRCRHLAGMEQRLGALIAEGLNGNRQLADAGQPTTGYLTTTIRPTTTTAHVLQPWTNVFPMEYAETFANVSLRNLFVACCTTGLLHGKLRDSVPQQLRKRASRNRARACRLFDLMREVIGEPVPPRPNRGTEDILAWLETVQRMSVAAETGLIDWASSQAGTRLTTACSIAGWLEKGANRIA